MISSLNGKVQKLKVRRISYNLNLLQSCSIADRNANQCLKDRQFGKLELFTRHTNPEAVVETSIKHYGRFSLEKAYKGMNFFWGLAPQGGDTIKFTFKQPVCLKRSGRLTFESVI